MSKNNVEVELEGAIAPFDNPSNGMEIIPVDNEQDDYEEVTPGQAALVLVPTMVVGYGVFRGVEYVTKKWVIPWVINLGKKLEKKKEEEENKKRKKDRRNIDPNDVTVEIVNPEEEPEDDDEYEADLENEDRYEKATKEILAAKKKKKNKRK